MAKLERNVSAKVSANRKIVASSGAIMHSFGEEQMVFALQRSLNGICERLEGEMKGKRYDDSWINVSVSLGRDGARAVTRREPEFYDADCYDEEFLGGGFSAVVCSVDVCPTMHRYDGRLGVEQEKQPVSVNYFVDAEIDPEGNGFVMEVSATEGSFGASSHTVMNKTFDKGGVSYAMDCLAEAIENDIRKYGYLE